MKEGVGEEENTWWNKVKGVVVSGAVVKWSSVADSPRSHLWVRAGLAANWDEGANTANPSCSTTSPITTTVPVAVRCDRFRIPQLAH